MREKMSKIMELVKENVTQVQVRQKHWYDQKACHWGVSGGQSSVGAVAYISKQSIGLLAGDILSVELSRSGQLSDQYA